MKTIQQAISVSFRYPVIFTHGVFDPENTALVKTLTRGRHTTRARALVVVDDGVAAAWPALCDDIARYFSMHDASLELVRAPLVVPGGEQAKNEWNTVRELMTLAAAEHMDRHSYFVAVGGGSMLDMVGFAAALIHRGLRFVRLPTTVLAQNDAGRRQKRHERCRCQNFVEPSATIRDAQRWRLRTLPQREWVRGRGRSRWRSSKTRIFFTSKAAGCDKTSVMGMSTQAALHLEHIATSGDPFSLAARGDFGHWAAHRWVLSGFTLGRGPPAIGITRQHLCDAEPPDHTSRHQSIIDSLATCSSRGRRCWNNPAPTASRMCWSALSSSVSISAAAWRNVAPLDRR